MQILLLALCLLGAIVLAYATGGASAQSVETVVIQSKRAELHSVVVDMPQVIDLSGASPDSWATLPPPVGTEDQVPATSERQSQSPAGLLARN